MIHVLYRNRLRLTSAVSIFLVLTVVFYISLPDGATVTKRNKPNLGKGTSHVEPIFSHTLTVVIRDFEDFENSIAKTATTISTFLGENVQVLIVADHLPYPPIDLSGNPSTQILTLSTDLSKNYTSSCVLGFIKSPYVLFVPDGVKINGWNDIKKAIQLLDTSDNLKAVAIAVENNKLECSPLKVSLKEWTVSFQGEMNSNITICSYIEGVHSLLTRTELIHTVVEPFARPFPYTFYLQATLKQWRVLIFKGGEGSFAIMHQLFKDFHSKWKRKQGQAERLSHFYRRVGIKREILKSGLSNYFGCSKTTARCFGNVINDMAQYLYEGKWTPPCCLEGLRECLAHVVGVLQRCKARYWLEGGSLLGAARHGDIIPWDYDVDMGIYLSDVEKCHPLAQAKLEQYTDDEDFVWERAREGEFYRVQYSQTNHLHVDIFPFYSKSGTMTKNSWFDTHPQDREFPESFLIPLTKIKFAGIEVSAPNNVREFLEYKFGKNVIEEPRYPNKQSPVL